jgi:hypothetical protein
VPTCPHNKGIVMRSQVSRFPPPTRLHYEERGLSPNFDKKIMDDTSKKLLKSLKILTKKFHKKCRFDEAARRYEQV